MKRDSTALTLSHFDLLVCGGGVYGAWTAYDAALRGLNVALIDKADWAGATSSASSKLIHGGLRYLESYDFKLVNKSLRERGLLLKAAPHCVWPLRFGVPIYADGRISRITLKIGLILYDLLAGIPGALMRHRYFNSGQFARRFSALEKDGIRGGFTYADAQTDDARLVLELIAGAQAAGAVCVNYCELIALNEMNGKATGATLRDNLNGQSFEIRAKQVVITSGQWLAAVETNRAWCRLSKGVHIILPKILDDEALLLTAKSDGRVFFMIPWYGLTLVGTTDTDYLGDIEHVTVETTDVDYLLREVNRYLNANWTGADVIGSYAGLRVMRHSDDASPSAVSRDWELKTTGNGVRYSIGGKLTSAREDAAEIVDAVCMQLGVDAACGTKGRAFPWAPEEFATWSAAIAGQARRLGIDAECSKWLIRRQGKRTLDILREIESVPALAERIVSTLPFIYAELLFCARTEMVVHLDDLLRRRIPLLILAKPTQIELESIAAFVSGVLDWNEDRVMREVKACHTIGR